MGKDPSFPMYASDWLGSSVIALMDAAQERGYFRLLCHMWNSDCALPDDDNVLSRLSLMGEGWLNGGCHLVRGCFVAHPEKPGFITHEKLLAIKAERDEWRAKSVRGGKKSAQLRSLDRESKGGSTTLATKVPTTTSTNVQPNANSSSSSPSSYVSSKEETIPGASKPARRVFVPPTVEEAREYIAENNYPVIAEAWWDFYASKGWMVGENKMQDWKAAVRTWAHSKKNGTKGHPQFSKPSGGGSGVLAKRRLQAEGQQ